MASTPIAIVADKLWRGRQTGVGRVTAGLTTGLAEHGADAIVIGFRDRTSAQDDRYGLPVQELWLPRRALAVMSRAGLQPKIETLLRRAISVVHNANIATPVRTRIPAVVTVFDLSPIDLPAEFSARVRKTFRESVMLSDGRGDIALCTSQATAARLIESFPGYRDRVVVGPLGPSLPPAPSAPRAETPTRILFVGEITRRKRPDLVVRAFERAELPEDWRLTIAGHAGNAHAALMAQVEESPVAGRIEVVLGASDERLAEMYARSSFLVLPSDLEGFGVPVLDAISVGLPVVVTEGSSLPEVAGPGGIVIPRGDADALASAMRTLALDAEAHGRLSLAGLRHASGFTWAGHAAAALRAYEMAAG